jgi:hypothetical protein
MGFDKIVSGPCLIFCQGERRGNYYVRPLRSREKLVRKEDLDNDRL